MAQIIQKFFLDQHYPLDAVMVEMFYICTVQYGSHWPHVDTEHLKYGQRD